MLGSFQQTNHLEDLMKLKSTIAALLLVTSMSTFAADITLSPIYTVVDVVRTALGTALAPFASTSASTAGMGQQLKAVRSDAVSFLADGESTDRLSASLTELKKDESLSKLNDSQLAALIVTSVD